MRGISAAVKGTEEICFCQEEKGKAQAVWNELPGISCTVLGLCKILRGKYTCALAYRKKLSYIRNLFKNEDYVELEKAFAGYTRMNDRCLKYEEAFETDPEVFDLYLKYLEKTGRISYMEKVKKYV